MWGRRQERRPHRRSRAERGGAHYRRMPVLARFPDGSCLSCLGGLRVRVIDCEITITTSAGTHTGLYRLATTLLDPATPGP